MSKHVRNSGDVDILAVVAPLGESFGVQSLSLNVLYRSTYLIYMHIFKLLITVGTILNCIAMDDDFRIGLKYQHAHVDLESWVPIQLCVQIAENRLLNSIIMAIIE